MMNDKKPYGIIYVLTSPSGKQYVGQTVQSLKSRLKGHKATANRLPEILLCRAINKYGIENFTAKQIDIALNYDELDILEEKWINKLNTMSPSGYNTRDVVSGQFSLNVRKRISESKMGHEVSRETRNKIRKSINKHYEDKGTQIIHGTTTGYSWYKCRCEDCKQAHKAYLKEYSKKVLACLEEEEDHGSFKAYRVGCRCEICKEFKSKKAKEYWINRSKNGRKNKEISKGS